MEAISRAIEAEYVESGQRVWGRWGVRTPSRWPGSALALAQDIHQQHDAMFAIRGLKDRLNLLLEVRV